MRGSPTGRWPRWCAWLRPLAEADDRDTAMAKLRLVAADAAYVDLVAERIGLAIGLATGSAPAEEISWATRQLLGRWHASARW